MTTYMSEYISRQLEKIQADAAIAMANPYVALLTNFPFLNVKAPPIPMVAAKGDGSTNDTAVIQALIDYAAQTGSWGSEEGGKVILCPPGEYLITSLIIRPGVHLIGAGIGKTILIAESTSTSPMIDSIENPEIENTNVVIAGLELRGNGLLGCIGISLHYATLNCFIEYNKIYNTDTAIDCPRSWTVTIRHNFIDKCLNNGIEGTYFHNSKVAHNRVHNTKTGLKITKGMAPIIEENVFEYTKEHVVWTIDMESVNILNNYFEWNCLNTSGQFALIFIDYLNLEPIETRNQTVNVIGNQLYQTEDSYDDNGTTKDLRNAIAIRIKQCRSALIMGNQIPIRDAGGTQYKINTGVKLEDNGSYGCKNVTLIGNNIEATNRISTNVQYIEIDGNGFKNFLLPSSQPEYATAGNIYYSPSAKAPAVHDGSGYRECVVNNMAKDLNAGAYKITNLGGLEVNDGGVFKFPNTVPGTPIPLYAYVRPSDKKLLIYDGTNWRDTMGTIV